MEDLLGCDTNIANFVLQFDCFLISNLHIPEQKNIEMKLVLTMEYLE